MKTITLCADDFGQNEAISQGIINLINHQRLSATSCMTNLATWPEHSQLLINKHGIDRGVHLNFTHGQPLSKKLKAQLGEMPSSLIKLCLLIFSKQLSKADIKLEINHQLSAFEEQLNTTPDFIDGHQHIQQLPIIRDALLSAYTERYGQLPAQQKPYIRISDSNAQHTQPFWLKKTIIKHTGAAPLRQQLIKHQIPYNKTFAGIYPFSNKVQFSEVVENEFKQITDATLFMCHPGLTSQDSHDPIQAYRLKEYQYLNSDAFHQLCLKHNIKLCRYISES